MLILNHTSSLCAAAAAVSLLSPPVASAQTPSRFDIVGLKLGQTIPEAVDALKTFNPDLKIEIRRVHASKFEKCVSGAFGSSQCANWLDGLSQPHRREIDAFLQQQSTLNETNSLVAGITAVSDTRTWQASQYTSGELDTIGAVVSAAPGAEKIIAIGRARVLAPKTYGMEELFQQLKGKYGPVFSPPQRMLPSYRMLHVLTVNNKIITTEDPNYSNCYSIPQMSNMDNEYKSMDAPLPNSIGDWCGVALSILFNQDSDSRWARSYGIYLADEGALAKVTGERASIAKRMMEDMNRDKLKATPKEKL